MDGPTDDRDRSVWDIGVQNERTALAWLRTALSLLVAMGAAARVAAEARPAAGIVIALLGLPAGLTLLLSARVRYRRAHQGLTRGDLLPSGRLPALTAGLVTLLGVAGLLYILLPADGR